MATYDGDFNKLKATFLEFLHHLPFYGLAVMCIDDPVVKEILPEVTRPVVTYGLSDEADFQISDIQQRAGQSHFTITNKATEQSSSLTLNMPGLHNALNATAAYVIARQLDVSIAACQKGLNNFAGIARRFNVLGDINVEAGQALLIDDYGHHPTELAAAIAATRASWPERRLVLLFQPHRYSRTRDLFDDFAQVLSSVDLLLMQEVYPAGEKLITGADSKSLCRAVRARGQTDPIFVEDNTALFELLPGLLLDGDILMAMGAGDIGATAQEIAQKLGGQKA
jgi:UDP-N-acetylmuramate--alanine ligase